MYRLHAGDMSPVSLVAGHQQMIGFALTASMVVLGEKLGTDLWIGQPVCYGLYQEPIFSGAMVLLNSQYRKMTFIPRFFMFLRADIHILKYVSLFENRCT
jgi:hypothetical protein